MMAIPGVSDPAAALRPDSASDPMMDGVDARSCERGTMGIDNLTGHPD